jgi:DNA repair exonuclease SbcCD ATPase subunit
MVQAKTKELEEQLAAKTKECDVASADLKKWMTAAKLLKKQNKEMETQLTEVNAKLKDQSSGQPTSADSEAMEKLAAELKALRDQLKEREDEAEVAKAGMCAAVLFAVCESSKIVMFVACCQTLSAPTKNTRDS